MRLFAIQVYSWREGAPILLGQTYDLNMLWFFQRNIAKEHILFNSRTVAGNINPGEKAKIALENEMGNCFCWTGTEKLCVTLITDKDYPERIAFAAIHEIMVKWREFFPDGAYLTLTQDTDMKYPHLDEQMKIWTNPKENDKILKIQSELGEVHDIMRRNLEEITKRGESIDELMLKSKDLSAVSVDFYKKAKKQNEKCCNLS